MGEPREDDYSHAETSFDMIRFGDFPQNQVFGAAANPYGQQPLFQQQQQPQQQQQWPQSTGMTGFSFADPITAQQHVYNNNQQTGFGNSYPQQQGFPQSLQAQMTGMPSSLQAQMTGAPFQQQQPQFTGMPSFQTNQSMAAQQQQPQLQHQQYTGMPAFQTSTMTGINPFGQQQMGTTLQPQQTSFSSSSTSIFGQSPSPSPFGSTSPFPAPQTATSQQLTTTSSPVAPKSEDPRYTKLNSLLANRE